MAKQNIKLSDDLTPQQKYNIEQVIATFALEGMESSEDDIRRLEAIALGKISTEEAIAKIIKEYKENA